MANDMKSNKLTVVLLIGAILAGGAGWMLSKNYISKEVRTHKAAIDAGQELVKVIVAKRDLVVGDKISKSTVAIRSMPRKFIHSDYIPPSGFNLIQGSQVISPLSKGDAMLKSHVSKGSYYGFASLLEEGQRAVTISVTSLDTISGFLAPGNSIDLLVTLEDGLKERTVPLLTNVKVIATGEKVDERVVSKGNNSHYSEITLGLSLTDAARVVHAETVGTLRVLMRGAEDLDEDVDGNYITIDNLVDMKQDVYVAPVVNQRRGFEVIRGGKS